VPDLLQHLFAEVCGQHFAHTWTPGGVPLPCCQRCTGLYVGALAGAALHLWFKPWLTGRFLWIHGAFLLQMIPFGFHWLPQGPLLRTTTGVLFGCGLVSFFWLLPTARRPLGEKSTTAKYFTALALSLVLVLALANANSAVGAYTLATLAVAGLLTLAALALTNLWLLVGQASRLSPSNPPSAAEGKALSPSKTLSPPADPGDVRDRRDACPTEKVRFSLIGFSPGAARR
jgi:uncharacterized membrane protein